MSVIKPLLSMASVNQMSYGEFISTFREVVEHGDLIAATVWSYSPFPATQDLPVAFAKTLDELSEKGKQGVLRLYPDLAGKLAKSDQLTDSSKEEHKAAGLDKLTPDEQKTMADLNEEYKHKFTFPFVICAKKNKKEEIIQGLKDRLNNTPEEEVRNGINEVKEIANIRLNLIIEDSVAI